MALLGAVLTMDTSAVGVTGVPMVLELLLGSGSVTPGGNPIDAVLVMVPVAPGATVPLIVMTKLAPEGRVGTEPETVFPKTVIVLGQAAPPLVFPHDAETPKIALGTASENVVPPAALGPALLIRMV